jgi:acyl-CoA thioesterase I
LLPDTSISGKTAAEPSKNGLSASFNPELVRPFWNSTIMRRESLFFIKPEIGDATASLIFPPEAVIELTGATGETRYEPGRDYVVGEGSPCIIRPSGSSIPVTRGADVRELWNSTNGAFHHRQVAITYTHAPGLWRGFVPQSAGAQLPLTTARLRRGEPLTISLAGDSISEGHNASGFMRLPPHQPGFGELVAAALQHTHGSAITFHNFGAEGWTTDHGHYIDDVLAPRPNLVLVAYGMNDLGHHDVNVFFANTQRIIASLRRALPEVELVLIAPMLANPEWDYPVHSRSLEYRDALAKLCQPGIALADVTSIWVDLLHCKSYYDLSGNGLNHPNDFGHRIYAQVILELLR